MNSQSPEVWIINLSVTLALCGVFFFLYGLLISNPLLNAFILASRASLLGGFVEEIEVILAQSADMIPSVPEGFFLAASVLVVSAAMIDVWRRLGKLQWSYTASR